MFLAGGMLVGCGSVSKAYEGGTRQVNQLATVNDSAKAMLISVDGVVYHDAARIPPNDAIGHVYRLAPGRRKIVVGRAGTLNALGGVDLPDAARYRATFDVTVEAGREYHFITETLEWGDDLTWNVWLVDRAAGKVTDPVVLPQKSGRLDEIRRYLRPATPPARGKPRADEVRL